MKEATDHDRHGRTQEPGNDSNDGRAGLPEHLKSASREWIAFYEAVGRRFRSAAKDTQNEKGEWEWTTRK